MVARHIVSCVTREFVHVSAWMRVQVCTNFVERGVRGQYDKYLARWPSKAALDQYALG